MSDYMKKGFDISYCQTKVDWSKVDAEFVIMRAGYGKYASQKDTMFESHYSNAKAKGIPCGAYWYSYCMDVEGAKAEAKACLEVIKGKQFEYPIFFDLEENSQLALGKEKVSAMIKAFLETVEAAGYWVGLYGSYSSLTNCTDDYIKTRYSIWLAHWDVQKSPYKGDYGVWQYKVGRANGITGDCDLDYCYVDYPTKIKEKGLNGYQDQATSNDSASKPEDNFVYQPRLSIPSKGNPYYNTKSKGGYSTAIVGKPTCDGLNVLANCFSGHTKIITRNGVVRLDSIVDQDVEVLSKDGVYRLAKGKHFGKQKLYKVILKNGQEFECTDNHRWYVKHDSYYNGKKYTKFFFKETKDLKKSDYIPYVFIKDDAADEDAIRHGFIYGDGSYYNSYRQSRANVCGFKKTYMLEYFKDALHSCEQKNGTISFYPYPKEYKTIPETTESLSYLRGFIKGLIASDGCVDIDGSVRMSTVKKDDADKISEICSILGYRNTIKAETRDTNYKKCSTIYNIKIKNCCLPISMFINPKQQDRVMKTNTKNISYTRVKEVIDTGIYEDVYCVQEPETHTMTLDGCILTGQCVGYAFGRFNEIIAQNSCNYLQPVNAEDFVDVALSQGLTVSQKPSLGAVICWAKGKTHTSSDGAGHVAVVEQINADGSIVTSESGYNCSNPFWTQKRSKGNGNWGQSSAYRFLGFIENPRVMKQETKENRSPYKEPTQTVKEGSSGDDVRWLQWYLKDLKYYSEEINGQFDINTLGALLAFQFKNNLEVDGKCGPGTRQALINA